MANTQNNKNSFKDGLISYFKGVRSEWGKVTWPEKNQIIFETGLVAIVVFLFTVIVFLLDKIFGYLLGLIAR
ncbi:MAG: preprotein translocase subunit SecE [Candidatus Gastranaerophilales bacterium]|nr:preprotein translocase subunit SecE [Candidatus Gastranaerophilales bacterium]